MTVTIEEAAGSLPDLVAKAAGGEVVIIETAGQPVARLVSVDAVPELDPARVRGFGSLKGKIRMADDFDAPLPDDMLRSFGVID